MLKKYFCKWNIEKILIFMFLIFTYFMFIFSFQAKLATAFPPVAAEYYGIVTINNNPGPIGTRIAVYDNAGNKCGSFEVSNEGRYGFLSCKGDDIDTEADEGATRGEDAVFYINGRIAKKQGNANWQEGAFREVNISTSDGENENHKEDSEDSAANKNAEESFGSAKHTFAKKSITKELPSPQNPNSEGQSESVNRESRFGSLILFLVLIGTSIIIVRAQNRF